MPNHSEAAHPGEGLRCSACGTSVRMRSVGGGRMDCCAQPMESSSAPDGAASGRVHCAGCGNEADVLHEGGGTLACCDQPMERTAARV